MRPAIVVDTVGARGGPACRLLARLPAQGVAAAAAGMVTAMSPVVWLVVGLLFALVCLLAAGLFR